MSAATVSAESEQTTRIERRPSVARKRKGTTDALKSGAPLLQGQAGNAAMLRRRRATRT